MAIGYSFASSAWERAAAKLCFASCRLAEKQSFSKVRSQAELGNEARSSRARVGAITAGAFEGMTFAVGFGQDFAFHRQAHDEPRRIVIDPAEAHIAAV